VSARLALCMSRDQVLTIAGSLKVAITDDIFDLSEGVVHAAIEQNYGKRVTGLASWYKDEGIIFPTGSHDRLMQTAIAKSSLAIVQAVPELPRPQYRLTKKPNGSTTERRASVIAEMCHDCS